MPGGSHPRNTVLFAASKEKQYPTTWLVSSQHLGSTVLKTMTRGVGARRERIRPEMFAEMILPMPTFQQQSHALKTLRILDQLTPLQVQTVPELDALLPSILTRLSRENCSYV